MTLKLRTLGNLSVEGVMFRRQKVLLLLAYLCTEGPQPRRRLADLFWPEAANPMNSLAQHLVHLRTLPGAVQKEGSRVQAGTEVWCDATALRELARNGELAEATALYSGPFLDALTIPLGVDLEEWMYETREALAREVRGVLLGRAAEAAAHGRAAETGALAAQALDVAGAPPPDELELPRLHHLLHLAGHPLAAGVERDAHALGLRLGVAPELNNTPFVGREDELAQLTRLGAGEVAWISAPGGMGKSALLLALARAGDWTVLMARGDRPYGTLEPLTRGDRPPSAAAPLAPLRDPALRVAVDDWEHCDAATQAALALAARQRPGAAVLIVSRRHPPFDVDLHLELGPLPPETLEGQPGLHALTDGHPTLVGAALAGETLDGRHGATIRALPSPDRDAFLLLALQDAPDLRATCRALGLSAADFAVALGHLVVEGLVRENGQVYAAAATRERIELIHIHAHLMHLKLARALPEDAAWPHYELARDLWEDADEDRAAQAAGHRAGELLERGYPGDAVALLDPFTRRPELAVPHAYALLSTGRYAEALERLEKLGSAERAGATAAVARATALVRLGRHEEAAALAAGVGGSGPEAARAASVLAVAAHMREQWDTARRYAQISADLWQLAGNENARLGELILVAKMNVRLGAAPAQAFGAVLEDSRGLPSVRGTALVNYAQVLIDVGQAAESEAIMHEAVTELTVAGDRLGLAAALINMGVRQHLLGHLTEAESHYRDAIRHLKGTGNVRFLGLALSNLSEIQGDLSAFEDTLEMLTRAGQTELVAHIRHTNTVVAPTQRLRS
ncbi:tetratricopeptide repeat protein [Deinococcus arenicola]|uniref:Tetratricopeptide repeat protein n=1 Tax=Deinococcus arenicola TaxID=2994950 RepID=A0ABU4DPR4_9DEIO|nr:tetratricopeptide repeat protein [Deinococcus sp. ZS9-10]MDV6373699.1 tetratricopeptide repeat protein [Deinococcus sp. ZS9-10]